MKKCRWSVALVVTICLLAASSAMAAEAKTYQVTGPVLEVTPTTIVVQKGKDRWELSRSASTNLPADLKVGDKVTIEYRMVAVNVEVKPAAGAKPKTAKSAKKPATK